MPRGESSQAGGEPMEIVTSLVYSPPRAELGKPEPELSQLPPINARREPAATSQPEGVEVSENNWCSFRFINWRAHALYGLEFDDNISVTPEKEFPRKGLVGRLLDIYQRENIVHWGRIIRNGPACSTLAREMYANIFHFDAHEGAILADPRVIFCRKTWVVVSPASIARFLRFPALDAPCAFEAALADDTPPAQTRLRKAVEKFCYRPGVAPEWIVKEDLRKWRTHVSGLTLEARWLSELLCCWVYGYTKLNYVSFDVLLMAHCLYQGKRVDLPKRIYKSILQHAQSTGVRTYGHPYVLQGLAIIHEVRILEIESDLPALPPRLLAKVEEAVNKAKAKDKGKTTSSSRSAEPRRASQLTITPQGTGQSGESEIERGFRLAEERAVTRHKELLHHHNQSAIRQSEMMRHQEETRYIMTESFRQFGEVTARLDRQMQELGIAREHTWESEAPGSWQYVPPVFPHPPPPQETDTAQTKKRGRGAGSSKSKK